MLNCKTKFVLFFTSIVLSVTLSTNALAKKRAVYVDDEEEETVTRNDDGSRSVQRHQSLDLWSFGFGPYTESNLNIDGMIYGFSIGRHFEVSDLAEIRAEAFTGINSDGFGLTATIGAALIPLTSEISPVIGAGVGFGLADGIGVDTQFGFAGTGIAGLRMFRSSTTQLELAFRYHTVFSNNGLGLPALYGAEISILF